jgi:hypothetical protein
MEEESAKALGLAALAYARLRRPNEARPLLDLALTRLEARQDPDKRLAELREVVEPLAAGADANQIQATISMVRAFTEKSRGVYELARLCRELLRFGRRDVAALPAKAAAELAAEAGNQYAFVTSMEAAVSAKDRPAVEIALAGIRSMQNRQDKAVALAQAARLLVRGGSKLASGVVNEARTLISALQRAPAAQATLAEALARMKLPTPAATVLRRAIYYAHLISPEAVYATVREGSEMLVSIDGGATLARCMESVLDVEGWWPENADE